MGKSTNTVEISQDKFDSIISELELYKNKFTQANSAYQRLLYSFKEFQRNRFGSKSERFVDEDNPQADLFAALSDDDFALDDEEIREEADSL